MPPQKRQRRPVSLAETVGTGDLRAQLEAIRDRLATELATVSGRDVAPIARQLVLVCTALDGLPAASKSALDDLAERRRARRQAAVSDGAAIDG